MKPFKVTKFYGLEAPYKCLYRDWTKNDERGYLSGHAIRVKIDFHAPDEDIMTVGRLEDYVRDKSSWIDEYLHELFSDTTLVSTNDPLANVIVILETEGITDIRLMKDVSMHGFNRMLFEDFSKVLEEQTNGLIKILDLMVFEASYT